ncbi:MAG: LytT sensor histidine kinase [Bacteroidota bacterium]|jgi:hypothetical protein
MSRRERIYWLCQWIGWGLFASGAVINVALQGRVVWEVPVSATIMMVLGIGITHAFRTLLRRANYLSQPLWKQALLILPTSLVMSLLFSLAYGALHDAFLVRGRKILVFDDAGLWIYMLNFTVLFLVWTVVYFAVHYFENFRKAEIHNLELRATSVEVELNNLRSQLRPHFMFNSLNSIRALIDEDPVRAKEAVTILSSVLRNSLLLGKHALIPLSEEMELVEKYLEMEKIRFEDRLQTEINISPDASAFPVPPLMVQTLVENGVKHGIAVTRGGGRLIIRAAVRDRNLEIAIANTGTLGEDEGEGTGLQNTQKRLQLIYGNDALFSIEEVDSEVICVLRIPQKNTL